MTLTNTQSNTVFGRQKETVAQRIQQASRRLFPFFDARMQQKFLGLGSGELTVLGAPTGGGKSTFMLFLALWYQAAGYRVLIVMGEMKPVDLLAKIVASEMGIDWAKVRYDDLTNAQRKERDRLWDYYNTEILSSLNIADSSSCGGKVTTDAIVKWIMSRRYDIVFVDYAQAICVNDTGKAEVDKLAVMMSKLEEAAMESDTAVLLASQLNRESYNDLLLQGKAPQLSWLQGSSKIEQKSWSVYMLLRAFEEKLCTMTKKNKAGEEVEVEFKAWLPVRNMVSLWCVKHRVKGWEALGTKVDLRFFRGKYGDKAIEAQAAEEARRLEQITLTQGEL